jgi:hypothetical protein
MTSRIGLCAALVLCIAAGTAYSQQTQTQDNRLDQLERRLNELEQKHQVEIQQRDQEIQRLREQLQERQPATQQPTDDEIEQTRQAILDDIESRRGRLLDLRPGASLNPDIAVIADFVASYSPNRENEAHNRFDVREVELDLRAAVDPRADGVVIVAFERHVHNPLFEDEDEDEEEGVESSVNIEEAYLFLHDFGIPNLTAKVGRFHLRFGRQNLLHLHDLPTTDTPFVNQAFLAPEALIDSGVSLSYVIPPRLVGGQYIEIIGEIITGEGAHSESPTLQGDLAVDSPAFNTHILWNTNLTRDLNFELGGSWLRGHADADNALDVNLFGVDATLLRIDPTGGFNNSLLQAEAIYGIVDQPDGTTERAWGLYLLGQQQLSRDWYTGLRLDWTQNPNDAGVEAWGVTPYVSWYWSEFLRFRLQYQHRRGDIETENAVYLQATWLFGAHPPHPYWSMR